MDAEFYYSSHSQQKLDIVEQGRVDNIEEHCRKIKEGDNQGCFCCFWQCLEFTNDPIYGCKYWID